MTVARVFVAAADVEHPVDGLATADWERGEADDVGVGRVLE